jgi:hypothetical protein
MHPFIVIVVSEGTSGIGNSCIVFYVFKFLMGISDRCIPEITICYCILHQELNRKFFIEVFTSLTTEWFQGREL